MANPNKPTRQYVLNKPPQKLGAIECHLALLVAPRVVPPPEAYLVTVEREQSMIADGHAMRVAPDVPKHLRWAAECRLRIDNPVFVEQRIDERVESLRNPEIVRGRTQA
jgi:hypothetical protein